MSSKEEDNDWNWQSLCRDFFVDSQIQHLESTLENNYGGDVKNFIQEYLEPLLLLFKNIKSSAENFFCASDKPDDAWVPYYKKFFNNIVHFTKLETTLHKGDFCINTSLLVPGHLIIRYHDAGIIRSLPLEGEDFPVMCKVLACILRRFSIPLSHEPPLKILQFCSCYNIISQSKCCKLLAFNAKSPLIDSPL
ncbi:PREDICTED: uncharacterized protein LOC107356718 [Acropora digitifera]|uniref:uncharacterized protein LOC107356718 n=1 Tax=Acropora digitifera TaxID=70779 RepID=UPI00077A9184|nr:PREDICTED: uncharacterized protein LOC107356718 [Acropora digitifera]